MDSAEDSSSQLAARWYARLRAPDCTPEEREQVHRRVLELLRRGEPEQSSVRREDLLGGVAVGLIILFATLPIVVPFLVVASPNLAVRISHLIALTELFLLGAWWGRMVGGNPLRIAAGLTLVGVALVLITIVLGG